MRRARIAMTVAVTFLVAAAAPAQSVPRRHLARASGSAVDARELAMFTLNTQDFAYPELSAATLARVLEIHDRYGVPLDVFLTGTIAQIYADQFPELIVRLQSDELVAVDYHIRPPLPYYSNYDWLGLGAMSRDEQLAVVRSYESQALDLVTGQPLDAPGGFTLVAEAVKAPPLIVGDLANEALQPVADQVFRELGARFCVVHGRASNLGEMRNGLFVRPEHVDLRLYEHLGEDSGAVLSDAFAAAGVTAGAVSPFVVGIKMHDNNFFAAASAWTTVYLAPGARQGPPWDTSLRATLLDPAAQDAMWALYESAVAWVAARSATIRAVNAHDLATMVPGAD